MNAGGQRIPWQRYLLRLLVLTLTSGVLGLTVYVVRASKAQPVAQEQVALQCKQDVDAASASTGRYFFHPDYGWFDRTHFKAGNPRQVIADVRQAARAGGGTVIIEQILHDGAAGYTASYNITHGVERHNEMAVALGIYQDWSYRFEAWQGQLPQRLAAMLSSFAVEDLPSHYLGFFAAARGLQVEEVFACFLPQSVETDESPPRFTTSLAVAANTEAFLNHPQRLVNEEMRPMVRYKDGWYHVAWPTEMQMETIDSSTGLWGFVAEDGWYFNEEDGAANLLQGSLEPVGTETP